MDMPHNEVQAERVFERCVGNQDRVELLDNYVIDTVDGYGMVIDSSTCKLEQNQVKKNAYGGILVTTSLKLPRITHGDKSHYLETETASNKQSLFSSRIDQIRCFSQVTLDQLTAYQNQKFGVAVRSFYGTVHILNSVCSENEGHGVLLTNKPTRPHHLHFTETNTSEIMGNGPSTSRQTMTGQNQMRIDPAIDFKISDFVQPNTLGPSDARPFDQ
jgi:hypothetical protein